MKQVYLFFLFLINLNLSAQDRNTTLYGKVTSNSIAVESVHIINQTSKRGTISNKNGEFKITAKKNDTLQFSNIQYNIETIIITIQQLQKKELQINLVQKTNELNEVVIVKHKNIATELSLPNTGKKPLDKLERNLNAYSQESLPIVIIATLLGQQGGIDDIYNIVSGNRKRDRKLKKLVDADKDYELKQDNIQIIREHFTDDFFNFTIQIEKDHIDNFIDFCIPKKIEELYKKQRYLEVMDIFIQNKDNYLTSINKPIE